MNGMHMEGHLGKRHRSEDMGSHADHGHGQQGPPRKRKDLEPMPPNHILLFTVINPVYPITCDILHTICTPHARVIRIVIFQKNGVQAMVEFESVEAACAVREQLNGADIYSGCCTLKIEFAKPTRLNVNRNDSRSWDYSMPAMGHEQEPPPVKKAPLLPEPPAMDVRGGGGGGGYPSMEVRGAGGYPESRHGDGLRAGNSRGMSAPLVDRYSGDRFAGASGVDRYSMPTDRGYLGGGASGGGVLQDYGRGDGYTQDYRRDDRMGGARRGDDRGALGGMGGGGPQQGCVLMVYDMDKNRMNPDRLFNILCQYGNVVRIKFLKSKEGCAMVQMEDNIAVERVLNHLNSLEFFGSLMQLSYSKQPYLNEVQQPHNLADGSSSFADFSRNRNNRFLDPAKASKNRIQGPSRILHFYNMPPGMSNDDINDLFSSQDLTPPETIKMFPVKSERSCSGLLEFATVAEAVEALAVVNHMGVPHSNSKFPYTLKLCFSSTRGDGQRGGGGGPRRDDNGARGGSGAEDGDHYY